MMFDPCKEHDLIVVEGRFEVKPEPEEDEEEDGPKEFEMPDDGKRYGGAFKARADLLEKYESKHGK